MRCLLCPRHNFPELHGQQQPCDALLAGPNRPSRHSNPLLCLLIQLSDFPLNLRVMPALAMWPLGDNRGGWEPTVVHCAGRPVHLTITLSLFRDALWGAFTRDTGTLILVCSLRGVYLYTFPPDFFVTNFQSFFFQVPDHPAKPVATAHESVNNGTPGHSSSPASAQSCPGRPSLPCCPPGMSQVQAWWPVVMHSSSSQAKEQAKSCFLKG